MSPVCQANSRSVAAGRARWPLAVSSKWPLRVLALVGPGAVGPLAGDQAFGLSAAHVEPLLGPAGDEVDGVVGDVGAAGDEAVELRGPRP